MTAVSPNAARRGTTTTVTLTGTGLDALTAATADTGVTLELIPSPDDSPVRRTARLTVPAGAPIGYATLTAEGKAKHRNRKSTKGNWDQTLLVEPAEDRSARQAPEHRTKSPRGIQPFVTSRLRRNIEREPGDRGKEADKGKAEEGKHGEAE